MTKIMFCGDFISNNPSDLQFTSKLSKIFNSCDIKVCNFEAPIENDEKPIRKVGPNLTQSIDAPKFLENLGFNVIQLANNHIYDYGKEGLLKTKSLFKSAILLGAGNFEDAYKIKIINVKGCSIGFMSLTHYEFGVLGDDSQDNDFGTAWINHPIVNANIIKAKKDVDFLFILPHAGVEHIDAPLPEWRSRYKEFIDIGADGVIASHPHVPQGWEIYKEKYIFYSLGNFCFETIHKAPNYWNNSLIVELEILSKNDLNYIVRNIKKDNNLIIEDDSLEIKNHTEYILNLLSDEKTYREYIDKMALKFWETYYLSFMRGLGSFSFKGSFLQKLKIMYSYLFQKQNTLLLLNSVRCESHRWLIVRALCLFEGKCKY